MKFATLLATNMKKRHRSPSRHFEESEGVPNNINEASVYPEIKAAK